MFALYVEANSQQCQQSKTVTAPMVYHLRAQAAQIVRPPDFIDRGYAVRYSLEMTDEEIIKANGLAGGFEWLDDPVEDGY